MLCIFAGLGLGRFTLGMLLPAMSESLHLTYSQMGFISTANFTGYLAAVLTGGFISERIGARMVIFISLLVVSLSMGFISQAKTFEQVLLLYTLTGIGSGAANVPMMGLVSTWFARNMRGRAAGFIVIGSGFAIILSGIFVPLVNEMAAEGWRSNWLILGTASGVVAFICLLLLRNRPEEKGLLPYGSNTIDAERPVTGKGIKSIYSIKGIYLLAIIYFLFGCTYVIYATFIVTTLVQERGFSESLAGNFWSWIGFLSLFSGPVFGTLSDRFGRKTGLITVFSFQMMAYLMIALKLPAAFLYASIFFFGIVAWRIPSIMIAAVSDYAGARKAVAAFGFVTFIFGLGQISGPAIAGVLAEQTGSFSSSFLMAAALAGTAIILSTLLKKPEH